MILARLPRTALCVLALSGAPALAFATPIVDQKIGEAWLSKSDEKVELAELRALTGISNLVLGTKMDSKDASISLAGDLVSTWILTDTKQPGYFALKFGTGNGNTGATANTFLFKNIGDLTQLVWSNDQVQSLTGWSCDKKQTNCQVERLSHYITAPAVAGTVTDSGQKETGQGGTTAGGEATGSETAGGGLGGGDLAGGGLAGGGLELETGAQEGSSQESHDVPEPGGLALLAMGALAVYGARRRPR